MMLAKPKPKPEDEPSSTISAAVESPATDDREAEIERRLALLTPAMDEDMDTNKDMDTPPDVTIEEDLLAPVVVSPPPVPAADPVPVAVKEVKSNPKSALLVSLCSQSVSRSLFSQSVRHTVMTGIHSIP